MDQNLFVLFRVFVIAGVAFSDPVINECSDGGKYIFEDTAATFTCSNYGTQMSWYLDDVTDTNKIGSCDRGSCSSKDTNRFNLNATRIQFKNFTSQLEIKKVTREQAGSLICDVNSQQDNCELHVIADEAAYTTASTKSLSGGLVGGVTAAAVIVLVIIVVVVVYIMKRRKGVAKQEGRTSRFSSDFGNYFKQNNPFSKLYAVVKKPKIQTPIERHSAPSGDLYTIPSSVTTQQGQDEYTSVYEEADNTIFHEESACYQKAKQVVDETNKWTVTAKPTAKPAVVKNSQESSDAYMNVTDVSTDSGLGVYHVVPWASKSGTMNPDSSTQATSEDEYNALHFEQNRSGQEDLDVDYNHLNTTQNMYFTLEQT